MTFFRNETAPIRVLFIDHTAKLGGGEIALVNLLRSLDRGLVDSVVLLFEDGPLVERLRLHADTHVLALSGNVGRASKDQLGWRSLLQCKAVFLTFLQVWKVARFSRRMRVDLIHTNSLKADIIGGIAARLAGVPVLWHVRDRIETDYLPPVVVRGFRFLAGVVPNFIIANSASTLATLRLPAKQRGVAIASGIVLPERASVVHDGFHGDQSGNSKQRHVRFENASDVCIALIGRISPWKGQHIFLQAAALLQSGYPNARFEIIGAPLFSEHEYEASLQDLVRSLGIERIVAFRGFVDNIPERIAKLDIVVHASTTPEPFGQVIIEAMAAGKPLVATDGGGAKEIVVDGVTGLLVPMGDAPKMAEAIAWLMDNPEKAAEMGEKGKERVLADFTIQKTARTVEQVYRDMLDSRAPTLRVNNNSAPSESLG